MAKQMTPPRAKRLTAEARRHSILEAARRAFSETGDMNGTTIRAIAEKGGISEGIIYRHFESKDQLFIEAVVEPLRESIDALVHAAEVVDQVAPLDADRQLETLEGLYRQLVATLGEVLPLLGLVLFGDPVVAKRFYKEHFAGAMDRLGDAWGQVQRRHGITTGFPDVSARAVMGVALILAMEARFNPKFDKQRAIELVTLGSRDGFFPGMAQLTGRGRKS